MKKYLKKTSEEKPEQKLLLLGDFNFPSNIVLWEKTNEGVFPNPSSSNTPLKRCYDLLERITEQEGMEQIVEKPTRENNILDLIYSNNPQSMSPCTVTNIQPLSDHNLVRTEHITRTNTKDIATEIAKPSLAAQINFRAIDDEAYKKELEKINWEKTLDVPDDKMSAAFVKEVCEAAVRVNAPRFRSKGNKRAEEKLKILDAERARLQKQNEHPSVTEETKTSNNLRIKKINLSIATILKEEREAEEVRVIKTFRINSRDFYRYANKFRKSKDKVGPLKTGNNYESGEKKMAEILSDQ